MILKVSRSVIGNRTRSLFYRWSGTGAVSRVFHVLSYLTACEFNVVAMTYVPDSEWKTLDTNLASVAYPSLSRFLLCKPRRRTPKVPGDADLPDLSKMLPKLSAKGVEVGRITDEAEFMDGVDEAGGRI